MRIGLKKNKKQQHTTHTKSVARLVNTENWSKKKLQNPNKKTTTRAPKKCC